jgi:aspartokinase
MSNEAADRFTYSLDAERRLVRVVALEALTADDLIGIIDRQLAEGRWSFGTLYDLRRTDRITSREDATTVVTHVQRLVSEQGPRGPVAMVTSRGEMVGAALIYAFHTTHSMPVEVFWDIEEANTWLAARVSRDR